MSHLEIDKLLLDQNYAFTSLLIVIIIGHLLNYSLIRFTRKFLSNGVSIGSASFLCIGILFGLMGIARSISTFTQFGIYLFLYTTGIIYGPIIPRAISKGYAQQLVLMLSIMMIILLIIISPSRDLFKAPEASAGLFAGVLTSTPGLTAMQGNLERPTPAIAAFSITYICSMFTIIITVIILSSRYKAILPDEAAQIGKIIVPKIVRRYVRMLRSSTTRVFSSSHVVAARIYTPTANSGGYKVALASPDVELSVGQVVRVVGTEEGINQAISNQRGEILPVELEWPHGISGRDMTVCNTDLTCLPISQLNTLSVGIVISRVDRDDRELVPLHLSRIDLDTYVPSYATEWLELGDRIRIVGSESDCERFITLYGRDESKLYENRVIGMVGMMVVAILAATVFEIARNPKVAITGSFYALAVLISGVVASFKRNIYGINMRLTPSTRTFLKELGLAIFMCGVGVTAGTQIMNAYATLGKDVWSEGLALMAYSILTTFGMSRIAFSLISYKKSNCLLALCTIACFFTSSLAIDVIKNRCGDHKNAPEALYAMAYPFSLFLIVISCVFITLSLSMF
jgi:putative transport protein